MNKFNFRDHERLCLETVIHAKFLQEKSEPLVLLHERIFAYYPKQRKNKFISEKHISKIINNYMRSRDVNIVQKKL